MATKKLTDPLGWTLFTRTIARDLPGYAREARRLNTHTRTVLRQIKVRPRG